MIKEKTKAIKPKRARNLQDKSRYYVTNEALLAELQKMKESPVDPETGAHLVSQELGKMLYSIAKHLTYYWAFKNYPESLKEDMISHACYKMIKYINSYNFEYKNPFAYFTQICYNAFLGPISQYYKEKNLKRDLTISTISEIQSSKYGSMRSTYLTQIQKSLQSFLDELNESKDGEEGEDGNEPDDVNETE
jgi:DNA-directed RNA polymerase specialized sigma subunit